MDNNVLYPPNLQQLSESVVRHVVQRTRPQSLHLFAVAVSGSSSMHQPHNSKNLPMADAELHRAAAEIQLRRQRNRMHQAKHKMKQQKKVIDLEISIRWLREEVQRLKLQKEVISASVTTNATVWSIAVEYFRLFRNGYRPPTTAVVPSTSAGSLQRRESSVQRDFFIATMAEDVAGDIGYGVGSLMENWRKLSLYHDTLTIDLVRLDIGPCDNLIATVRSSTTMSEKVLRHAFPHLFDYGAWTPLAARLVGQRIRMRGAVSFIWNEEKGRVVSLQYTVDMLTPIMQLLGNLEDTARVFDCAQLTPDSRLVVSAEA